MSIPTVYEDGQFKSLEYPLSNLDFTTEKAAYKDLLRMGYRKVQGFEENAAVDLYACPPEVEDIDYPYFVCGGVGGEAKGVFFKNWDDLADFVNKYIPNAGIFGNYSEVISLERIISLIRRGPEGKES